MPHSLADLLIHLFFSTKHQQPSNVQKHEIEYDETYLWSQLCTALSRARRCRDRSPRLKPWAIVVATLPGRPRNVETRRGVARYAPYSDRGRGSIGSKVFTT